MSVRRRRITVVTGSRADYGLLRGVMARLQAMDDVDFSVIACGMHLLPRFGETWRAIEADGFSIAAKVDLELLDDRPETVARGTGVGISGFAGVLPGISPDILVVLGDRYEILAAAAAAMLLNIPIAHIHGGEVTSGAFDDAIRHAITKMAALHFVAAEPYRQRVIQMGENPNYVFNVGAPGLDVAGMMAAMTRKEFFAELEIGGPEHFLLVTLHPETARADADASNLAAVLGALAEIHDRTIIFTGVNADPGYRAIHDTIADFVTARPGRAYLFTSLGSKRYWAALRLADAVIGNSSSGILEAPAAGVPSINIGTRQQGRLRASSVIDCPADAAAIRARLRDVLEGRFQPDLTSPLPYGKGGASEKIANILRTIDFWRAFPKYFNDIPIVPTGVKAPP